MTDRALDNLARRVMLDAARQEYGSLMAELPEHDFSPEFEKRMGRLVRRAARPIRHRAPRPEGASVTPRPSTWTAGRRSCTCGWKTVRTAFWCGPPRRVGAPYGYVRRSRRTS